MMHWEWAARSESFIIQENSSVLPTRFLTPARLESLEKLDIGEGSPEDVRHNLQEMWRINRYVGGLGALTQHLYPRLLTHAEPITILDLGTGSAEIPAMIVRWASQHHLSVSVIAVDWAMRNLVVAREHTRECAHIKLLCADATCLPLAPRSVDYVISSLFMHHFKPDELITLFKHVAQCARQGIIMTDLIRGWLPLWGFRLIQPLFARNFLTQHDGELSIRRAYTPAELTQLAAKAGLANIRLVRHWPWRMTLIADCAQ